MPARRSRDDCDVAIVGAGPVGLLLAGLLGKEGLRVCVLERRTEPPRHSQAIGVTPPSLQILSRLGLDEAFVQRGLPIRDCHVHGQSGWLGCASFREIPGPHRFILSIPQSENVDLMESRVATLETVEIRRGIEVSEFRQDADGVEIDLGREVVRASWLVGCDGHRSLVRDRLGVQVRRGEYGCYFVMGDFHDDSDLGDEAHLYFTEEGAIESFPLPGGLRRWIVQTDQPHAGGAPGYISAQVKARSGHQLDPDRQLNESAFSPRWLTCDRYAVGRVILCGDAAHLMSPIGGQGMNTGWADAEFLAHVLTMAVRHGQEPGPWLGAYERCRRRAAAVATGRAARGMWLGTRTGWLASLVRDLGMRHLLFRGPMSRRIGPYFAMLTIPFNTVERVPWHNWGLEAPAL